MSDAFGALTDHWGLTGASAALENKAVVIASNKEPVAQNRTDAEDEYGDVAASAYHGNSASVESKLFETSVTYQLLPGQSVNLNTLKLGELASGTMADSLTVTTTNGTGGNPTIEISGMIGTEEVTAHGGLLNTFTLPSITITGAMRAQSLGFTITEGKLTGSSLTASVNMEQQDDGVGEPVAHGVRGGTWEVSADIVRITTAPAWTVDDEGLTETKAPGVDEGQASWHTTNATAAGTLTRDASGS